MKKALYLFSSLLSATLLHAQEPADALRYSWTVPGGTARSQAIGGAMGSLGGDLSATFVNPAGLAFYRTGDLVFSPFFRFDNNKESYLNRTEKANGSNLRLGTTGFVAGSGQQGNKSKSVAVAFAFNRSADFGNSLLYRGANNQSSFSQQYLEEIRNRNTKDANAVANDFPFGTSLAFNTYWIDTVGGGSSNNYQFQSRAAKVLAAGGTLLQQDSIVSRGGINEFALGFGVNLNDKVMVGGTLGVPVLNYERNRTFIEADATDNRNNGFDFGSFTENLTTKGFGLNVKAGVIFKPQEYLRLGLAFHTPTLYSLKDSYSASVTTDTENYMQVQSQTSDFLTGAPAEIKYTLVTPYRAIASASYVLREVEDVTQQKGFITADIEYVDYTTASFKPEAENNNDAETVNYLKSLTTAIDRAYKSAFNFRLGGELKFTTWMVRAGAAYYGNPYQDINGEKGHKLNLSGGLGYRDKGKFIDLTYVHSMGKDVNFPYRLQYAPYSGATVKPTVGTVLMTVGFKF